MMHIIDPHKIEKIRDVIDREVAEITVETGCSRVNAYHKLAESLGYALTLTFSQKTGWWSGTRIIKKYIRKNTSEISDSAKGLIGNRIEMRGLCEFILDNTCFGAEPEMVAIGVIAMCLDEKVDIFMAHDELRFHFPISELGRVADAAPFTNLSIPDPESQFLFENNSDFEQRKFLHELSTEMRSTAFSSTALEKK